MKNIQKNTPLGAGTPNRAVENGTASQTARASTTNDTTSAAERQPFRISELLLPGQENAISRRELMSLSGKPDRELRLMIEAERRRGVPILSNCISGYYLPGSQEERDRCVRSLRRRAAEIMETADAIEQAEV